MNFKKNATFQKEIHLNKLPSWWCFYRLYPLYFRDTKWLSADHKCLFSKMQKVVFSDASLGLPSLDRRVFSAWRGPWLRERVRVLERMWTPVQIKHTRLIQVRFHPKCPKVSYRLTCYHLGWRRCMILSVMHWCSKLPYVNIWYGYHNLCSMNKLLPFQCLYCSFTVSRLHVLDIWMLRFNKHMGNVLETKHNSYVQITDCEIVLL